MIHVDLKYACLLSNKIERFSIKSHSPLKINMRCPLCGDSKKSKTKTRGWILEKGSKCFYYCHNCGASHTFSDFLFRIEPHLYDEYIIENKLENNRYYSKPETIQTPKKKYTESIFSDLKKISQISNNHPAKQYVVNRNIPSNQHYRLYYVTEFNAWVNRILPGKLSDKLQYDSPRLVIPFLDKNKNVIGFCGRSFAKTSKLRYITIMLDETHPKVFGMESLDMRKKFYVVEGPLDSLFLPNAVAMAGADLHFDDLILHENATIVLDNEKRNEDTVKRNEKLLRKGAKVCIWPSYIKHKDINDMVCSGMTTEQVTKMIDENTFESLEGLLRLNNWKRYGKDESKISSVYQAV
jgi:transcription elongation factor Elf1